MRNAHSAEAVRAAERSLMVVLPPGTLMQRAATGLAAVCADLLGRVYGARVVVLAGGGDNGGDALYAGALLARRGAQVTAVAAGKQSHAGGTAALRASGGRVTGYGEAAGPESGAGPGSASLAALLGEADLILDGLTGIGGRGGLREPHATLARQARDPGRRTGPGPWVVAVDLPSGVDADTGEVPGPAITADVTVTFGTHKPGLLIDPGAGHAGVVVLVDIGLDPYLPPPDATAYGAADVAWAAASPGRESDKYRRGVLGIVAGSDRFTGAAVLTAGGAIRGGAGMVRVICPGPAAAVVRQAWPETVITEASDELVGDGTDLAGVDVESAGRVQAWVAGPGMGTGEAARRRLAAVLASDVPVLVDADGLTLLAQHPGLLAGRSAPTLLTPHAGELARLLGVDPVAITARRAVCAREAAAKLRAWVLLKGSTTVIAGPPGENRSPGGAVPLLVNPTGTGWLATAGSGDVLSGLAGALLARGHDPAEAVAAAVFLHGLAARYAAGGPVGEGAEGPAPAAVTTGSPISAADVVRALPAAFRAVASASYACPPTGGHRL